MAESTPRTTLLAKSAQGASFLLILGVTSRVLTFAINQLLLRYLSPALLGISTQLEVYSISVLLFARESLRVAIQRQTDYDEPDDDTRTARKQLKEGEERGQIHSKSSAGRTQTVVNLSYISIGLGVFFAFVLAKLYLRSASASVLATPYINQALILYGIGAFWELLAEPCFIVAQQKSQYRVRAAAESVATVVRCIVTCGTAVWSASNDLDIGVLPFAFGQFMYGVALLLVYYRNIWGMAAGSGWSLMARPIFSR